MSEPWPFKQSPLTRCIVTPEVQNKERPILFAGIEGEGDFVVWMFLHDAVVVELDKCARLLLAEVFQLDPSVAALAELPMGWIASRESPEQPWNMEPAEEGDQVEEPVAVTEVPARDVSASSTGSAPFPPELDVPGLGSLAYSEFRFPPSDIVVRTYKAKRLTIPSKGEVGLVVWPPKTGVADPSRLAEFVRSTWDAIVGGLDTILEAALPMVADSISSFCIAGPDYTPPSAAALIQSLRLESIYINAEGDHKLMMNDAADLVGGHDLTIGLGRTLTPTYSYFDG